MPTPSSIVSFTTPTASNSPAKACAGPEANRTRRLDQTSSPVTKSHRPARLATRAASFRYGGRHHSGIPGGIIPLYPGDFAGIRSTMVSLQRVGDVEPNEAELEAARSSLATGTVVRAGIYPNLASRFDFWPVETTEGRNAVIGLAFDPDERPSTQDTLVSIVVRGLALVL